MRKIITSTVLILSFSLFSGSVFAGKIAACEEIKHDPAYKGLYGLCNAYWNANEKAQEKILAKFEKKAGPGGPGMPGLGGQESRVQAVCPCWAEGEIDLGVVPFDCQVEGDFMLALYDMAGVQYGVGTVGPTSCEYSNLDLGTLPDFRTNLSAEEVSACAADIMARLTEEFGVCL